MTKPVSLVLILVFAAICLGLTLLMPAAEVGMLTPDPTTLKPSTVPGSQINLGLAFQEVANGLGLSTLFQSIGASISQSVSSKDPNFPFYVYSLFLGLAMVAASIAINVIGREDSEEKTVLPVKK